MSTHRPFRFGVGAADALSRAEWVAYARKVEALGYSTLMTGEHLSFVGAGSLGPIAARNFPVVAGHGQRENTHVFVSRGVGTVYVPVRVDCPPEVAVLTLTPTMLA